MFTLLNFLKLKIIILKLKTPNIFDSDAICGSTHKIKVAEKMYNCIMNAFDEFDIPKNKNIDFFNLQKEMEGCKTNVSELQDKKCIIGLREKKEVMLNSLSF